MKAVLISIHPEHVQKILSGQKKIECRKTKPKLEWPFKVYIYCTYGTGLIEYHDDILPNMLLEDKVTKDACWGNCCNGKVVAEFVCERLVHVLAHPSVFAGHPLFFQKAIEDACLTQEEVDKYSGGKDVIGWEISQLKIYDKPKYLWEYRTTCKEYLRENPRCGNCDYYRTCGEYPAECACEGAKPVIRPPQSWCYVEELKDAVT